MPTDTALDAVIGAAVTHADAAEIKQAAKRCGLRTSEYVRHVLLRQRPPRALAVTHDALLLWSGLEPVMRVLRADSTNMNQLARAVNEARLRGQAMDAAEQALAAISEHAQRVQLLLAAMGEIRRLLNPPS